MGWQAGILARVGKEDHAAGRDAAMWGSEGRVCSGRGMNKCKDPEVGMCLVC